MGITTAASVIYSLRKKEELQTADTSFRQRLTLLPEMIVHAEAAKDDEALVRYGVRRVAVPRAT